MNILDRITEYRKLLMPEPGKYRIISSFAGTTMEAKGMVNPMFRPFETVKEVAHRNTNVSSAFDMYTDSLMDYPTIIQYKVAADEWEPYNKLISVHVPLCPFNCWHCYNDKKLYFSKDRVENWTAVPAEYIVDEFLKQHRQDWEHTNKSKRNESNILRITGGEPFLVPELILHSLDQLKSRRGEFKRAPFLWTETDLWPFISENNKHFKELREILPRLAEHDNLAVHPCVHGITDDKLSSTTGQPDVKLEYLLEGIKILLKNKIDIYPTFGSNVNPPEAIEDLFKQLYDINEYLPLRFALVRYDLRYPEIEDRLKEEKSRNPNLYSSYTSLRIWNTLLMKHYGVGYGVIPRHIVPLYDKNQTLIKPTQNFVVSDEYKPKHKFAEDDLIYVFKSSSRDDYHRELLDMLALPKGHIYKLEYDVKWMQDDLWQHMKMRPNLYQDRQAILIYADDRARHERFVPLRKIKVTQIEVLGSVVVFYLELGDFLYRRKIKSQDERTLRDDLEALFGKQTLPGTPLNKFILTGEDVATLKLLEHGSTVSDWREAIEFLHNEQCQAFQESLFFYIPKDEMEGLSQQPANKIETVYRCESGKRFSFNVYYSLPNYEAFRTDTDRRTIHFETSSDVIKALVPNEFVLSKYGSERLSFSSELLTLNAEKCTIFFKSLKRPFEAPAPQLTIEVKDIKGKAAHTNALGNALTGLAGAIIGLMGGAFLIIKEGTTALSQWHIFVVLLGVFSLLYLGGWCTAKYRKS